MGFWSFVDLGVGVVGGISAGCLLPVWVIQGCLRFVSVGLLRMI